MKDMENRGWEEMRKKLDVALPQQKKGYFTWWKFALPLLGLIAAVIAYFVVYEELNFSPNSNNIAAISNVETASNPSVELNNSERGIDETGADLQASNGSKTELNRVHVGDAVHNNVLSGSEYYNADNTSNNLGFSQKKKGSKLRDNTASFSEKIQTSDLTAAIIDNSIEKNKEDNKIPEESISDNSKFSLGRSLPAESIRETEKLNQNRNIASLVAVPQKHLTSPGFEMPSQLNVDKLPVIKNSHNFNALSLILKGGAFTHLDSKYSGITILPELNYNIGGQSILFANVQARYRRTKESVITTEFNTNVKEYFDSNNLYAPKEILINEKNVNINSFDIAFDLGYRYRIFRNMFVGAYGFARFNNIFDQSPVKSYTSAFSLVTNAALSEVNTTYESAIPKFNFGAGIDVNYRLDNRSSVYAKIDRTFDQKKDYEMCIGYGFRLF